MAPWGELISKYLYLYLCLYDILVSYDFTALFTNVPLNETINILVDKAFADDWFNQTYGLNLQKEQLTKLLKITTSN